jgi:hypothetical protein
MGNGERHRGRRFAAAFEHVATRLSDGRLVHLHVSEGNNSRRPAGSFDYAATYRRDRCDPAAVSEDMPMSLDATLMSRIQFAFTIGYHILWPA